MRIIRSYILKDFFFTFIFSLLALSLVMLLGNIIKLSDMVIRRGVDLLDALKIFLYFIPYLLGFTLPLSFLLGILLAMGRLIADNELVAINVAGVSIFKLLKIFLPLGIIFSLTLYILNDRLIPNFHHRYRQEVKKVYSKSITTLIEPGTFSENFPNHIIYVADMENNRMRDVFIYEIDENQEASQVTFAKSGEFVVDGDTLKLRLVDGFRDQNNPDKKELYRLDFNTFYLDIPLESSANQDSEKKPQDMRLTELKNKIAHFNKLGINPVRFQMEFYKRISFSFSIITFILLGFGVSLAVKHREKSINFGIAFLIAGGYYLLFIFAQALVEYNKVPPIIGMWSPNIIVIGLGLGLIYKYAHIR